MNERVAKKRAKERETQIPNENEENFDGVENREILVGKCVCSTLHTAFKWFLSTNFQNNYT